MKQTGIAWVMKHMYRPSVNIKSQLCIIVSNNSIVLYLYYYSNYVNNKADFTCLVSFGLSKKSTLKNVCKW